MKLKFFLASLLLFVGVLTYLSTGVEASHTKRRTPSRTQPPTLNSCRDLTPPTGTKHSLSQRNMGPVTATLTWLKVSGASQYALVIDDMTADGWVDPCGGNNGGSCSCEGTNSGDVCQLVTGTSFKTTLVSNHKYRWYVQAINACGKWSGYSTRNNSCLCLPASGGGKTCISSFSATCN